jgi:hypothetical protein
MDDLEQRKQKAEKTTQADIEAIEATCNRLEAAVRACRRRLRSASESSCDDMKKAVDAGEMALQTRKGNLTTHQGAVRRAQAMTSRSGIPTMAASLQKRVVTLDSSDVLPVEVKDLAAVHIDSSVVAQIDDMVMTKLVLKNDTKLLAASLQTRPTALLQVKLCSFFFGSTMTLFRCLTQAALPNDWLCSLYVRYFIHSLHVFVLQSPSMTLTTWTFAACGHDVVISNQGSTAEKQSSGKSNGGLVVASQPMKVNQLYEGQKTKM